MTVPTPLSIESDVAPVTCQARVADPPGATWEGDAVKEAITGVGGAGVTMTDVAAVKVPASFVALSM